MSVPQAATARPEHLEKDEAEIAEAHATQWVTIVWNDPVNLMTYVTYVFKKLFGYDDQKATKLMLDVHHEGKAVVTTGTREAMEHDTARLHAAGLWATFQPA
ncbi:ATP-dependent Clp protease adapter ClpS [Epidermidibacterium keratini]|nr:ATP-dependent Clp protease adapter ClpS [Epidermidibacterium keratini]